MNRLHYMTSTNAGLCHGNMTWCYEVRGLSTTGSQTCMKELTYPSFQQSWGLLVRPLNWGRLNFKSRNQITPKCSECRWRWQEQKTKRPGNSGLNVKPSFTHTGKTTREMMNRGRGQSNCHQQQNLSLWFSFSQKNNPQILPSQHQEIKYICYKFIMPTLVFFWVEY